MTENATAYSSPGSLFDPMLIKQVEDLRFQGFVHGRSRIAEVESIWRVGALMQCQRRHSYFKG